MANVIAQKIAFLVCATFAVSGLVLAEPKPVIPPTGEMSLTDAVVQADNIFIGEVTHSGGMVLAGKQVVPGDTKVNVVRSLRGSTSAYASITCFTDNLPLSLSMASHHKYLIFARKCDPPFPDTHYYFFHLLAADDSNIAQVEKLLAGRAGRTPAK